MQSISNNMLILSRKEGETITIGKDIHIKVLEVQGNKVRIGIEAPRDVSVNREEVLLKSSENKTA